MSKILFQRFVIFSCILLATIFLADRIQVWYSNLINFRGTDGFFGFNLSSGFISFDITLLFLSALFFSFLQKKIDFVFLGAIFIFTLLGHATTIGVTIPMYVSLLVIGLAGALLGYILNKVVAKLRT